MATPIDTAVELHRKKQVGLHERGLRLTFDVAQSLFSSFDVDVGTQVLLRTLVDTPARRVLDLGCGYGPIGIALQALDPTRHVDMVDRDALAVAFATHNAAANGFPSLVARPSLGYDDVVPVDEPYDLVAANLPAKAGPTAIAALLLDARHVLAPDGLAAVVVVAPLADHVRATLAAAAPVVEVVLDRPSRAYAVFHYRFTSTAGEWRAGFDRGIYDRASVDGRRTVYSLAEFDSLSFATGLAIGMIDSTPLRALVFNPGQGHVAAALGGSDLVLEDRDLLALRTSATGVGGDQIRHRALVTGDPDDELDLAVGVLREQEPPAAVTAELTALSSRSRELVVAGSSTAVTRAVAALRKVTVLDRKKEHGFSAARLRRA